MYGNPNIKFPKLPADTDMIKFIYVSMLLQCLLAAMPKMNTVCLSIYLLKFIVHNGW